MRKQFDRLVAEMKSPAIRNKVTQSGIGRAMQRLRDAIRQREGQNEHRPLELDFKLVQEEGFFPEGDSHK